jgi:PIN domain nuclease of toxin-antitoxin system
MLAARGRLSLRLPVEVWVARCERLSFLRFVPVDNDIARLAAQACGSMHADPADRIITATALYLGCPVATCDAKIQGCGLVPWVW